MNIISSHPFDSQIFFSYVIELGVKREIQISVWLNQLIRSECLSCFCCSSLCNSSNTCTFFNLCIECLVNRKWSIYSGVWNDRRDNRLWIDCTIKTWLVRNELIKSKSEVASLHIICVVKIHWIKLCLHLIKAKVCYLTLVDLYITNVIRYSESKWVVSTRLPIEEREREFNKLWILLFKLVPWLADSYSENNLFVVTCQNICLYSVEDSEVHIDFILWIVDDWLLLYCCIIQINLLLLLLLKSSIGSWLHRSKLIHVCISRLFKLIFVLKLVEAWITVITCYIISI